MLWAMSTRSATQPPPDTIDVLAAVIRRSNQFLVCQRPSHKRHGGLWEFPGGKFESRETALDAARRELWEELGVDVTFVEESLFSVHDPESPFVIHFVPTDIRGEPACLEHSAHKWADLGELMKIDLAPSDRRFVEFLSRG